MAAKDDAVNTSIPALVPPRSLPAKVNTRISR